MTKYKRIYTFHVTGIAVIDYIRPDKHNVVTLNYARTYTFSDRRKRPNQDKMWDDFRLAIMGQPFIERAWVDVLLIHETEPGVQYIKTNGWRVDIPYVYQFDGSQG